MAIYKRNTFKEASAFQIQRAAAFATESTPCTTGEQLESLMEHIEASKLSTEGRKTLIEFTMSKGYTGVEVRSPTWIVAHK